MREQPKRVFRRVDALGRAIIPVELRREVGLEPGAEFTTERQGGAIIIRPVSGTCPVCGGDLQKGGDAA